MGMRTTFSSSKENVSIPAEWPELCVGLLIMDAGEKSISSREAMQRTVMTSSLYTAWPEKVAKDMVTLKQAIQEKNFVTLGETAESNDLTMHATMLSAWPPICYASAETISAMHQVWKLRAAGLSVFFTQDAGPNLKLLFQKNDIAVIQKNFSQLEVVQPFGQSEH